MYQRILVAVDGSAASDRGVREAIQLAMRGPARLRLVHVVDVTPHGVPELGVSVQVYEQACRENGREVLARAAALVETAGIAGETALLEAGERQLSRVIAEEATRWGADLVVAGAARHRGLVRRLMGSVAEGVLERASVPVLLVRR